MNIQDLRIEAARRLVEAGMAVDSADDELEYYSWPEMFSTTAGPRGGFAGQMFTQFQIHAFFSHFHRVAVLCCAGEFRLASNFEPMMHWYDAKFIVAAEGGGK